MNLDLRMVKTSVYLPIDLREQLHLLAKRRRVPLAVVIRQALEAAAGSARPLPEGGLLDERWVGE